MTHFATLKEALTSRGYDFKTDAILNEQCFTKTLNAGRVELVDKSDSQIKHVRLSTWNPPHERHVKITGLARRSKADTIKLIQNAEAACESIEKIKAFTPTIKSKFGGY